MRTPFFLTFLCLSTACSDDVEVNSPPSSDAGLQTCPASGISKRPWVIHVDETSALVRWEACKSKTSAELVFSPEAGGAPRTVNASSRDVVIENTYFAAFAPDMPKDEAGTYTMFDAELGGLAAGTCYTYSLNADDHHTGRLCTSRASGSPFKILAMGDTNPGLGATAKLLAHAGNEGYDLSLHAGDIQYYASGLETWVYWFDQMTPALAQGAFLPAVGNHEYEKDDEYELYYQRFFDKAGFDGKDGYFRAQSGGVWFFFLNSEIPEGPGSEQFSWFEAQLADAAQRPGYRFSIVTLHRPMLTCGDKSQDDGLRAALEPLFEQHGVELVLQGHMHGYERFEVATKTNPAETITYLTVCGGGGALEDVDAHAERPTCQLRQSGGSFYQMTVLEIGATTLAGRTFDIDGQVRDQFTKTIP